MHRYIARLGAGFVTAIALCAVEAAATPLVSGGGTATCELGPGVGAAPHTPCALQAITAHPAWQPNNPDPAGHGAGYGGVWVSYANTGIGGDTLAPQAGSLQNPTGMAFILDVTETFNLGGAGALDLYVWADDTADVFLDDVAQFAANFTQGTCAVGAIGCEPGEYFHLNSALGAGSHTLMLRAYQTGSGTNPSANPFGLLYSGSVLQPMSRHLSVRAPDGMGLLLIGLLGLPWRRRVGLK